MLIIAYFLFHNVRGKGVDKGVSGVLNTLKIKGVLRSD